MLHSMCQFTHRSLNHCCYRLSPYLTRWNTQRATHTREESARNIASFGDETPPIGPDTGLLFRLIGGVKPSDKPSNSSLHREAEAPISLDRAAKVRLGSHKVIKSSIFTST